MPNPFSAGTGAVGVVSLGLQVCGKIVEYSQALRSKNEDIQNLADRADRLCTPLKELEELIKETRKNSPDTAKDLESKALSLQASVERLNEKIEKYKPVATQTVHEKAKSTLNVTVYPFKRKALLEIGDCLHDMESTLHMTVSIYMARNWSKFESKQESLYAKQDQILAWTEEIKRLQLVITAMSEHRQHLSQVKSFSEGSGEQDWLTDLPKTRFNLPAKYRNKRYSYYIRWLKLDITGVYSFATASRKFSIPLELQFCNVFTYGSELSKALRSFAKETKPQVRIALSVEQYSKIIENFIRFFQLKIMRGAFSFTDKFSIFDDEPTLSLVDSFSLHSLYDATLNPYLWPETSKFVIFLLQNGARPENSHRYSLLRRWCSSYIWTENDYTLVSQIIASGGPITWPPRTWIAKKNMQNILARHEDWVDLPAAYIAVIRESDEHLQALFDSGDLNIDEEINGITLMQLAMGWPVGVRFLLGLVTESDSRSCKYCSGKHLHNFYHYNGSNSIRDSDPKIEEYITSYRILLEAKYVISHLSISTASPTREIDVLVKELGMRRKMLYNMAKASIDTMELTSLMGGEAGLPDRSASAIYTALQAKGIDNVPHLNTLHKESGISIYYSRNLSPRTLEAIYQAGFTDVDQPSPGGATPLMQHCGDLPAQRDLEVIFWMINKGADLCRPVPKYNTKVSHILNDSLGRYIMCAELDRRQGMNRICSFLMTQAHCQLNIKKHILSWSEKDGCCCSCSVNGCSHLSVALRHDLARSISHSCEISVVAAMFRQFINFIVEWNESDLMTCRAIIRSLTFNAMGLTHTCCTGISSYGSLRGPSPPREESDLIEIREEEKDLIEKHEKLVSEFEARFDALGIPLMKFLQEVWYEQMVQYHSRIDTFDPEHQRESRRLGISLTMENVEIPYVVQLICDQIRVFDAESDRS